MENKGYNGWTNYETWNWYLWHGDSVEDDFGDIVRDCDRDVYQVSKAIQEWTDDLTENYKMPENGFFADILNAAIQEVNWYEIAEHIIEEIEPEESDNDGEEEAKA
jgi:hypothetical protein